MLLYTVPYYYVQYYTTLLFPPFFNIKIFKLAFNFGYTYFEEKGKIKKRRVK